MQIELRSLYSKVAHINSSTIASSFDSTTILARLQPSSSCQYPLFHFQPISAMCSNTKAHAIFCATNRISKGANCGETKHPIRGHTQPQSATFLATAAPLLLIRVTNCQLAGSLFMFISISSISLVRTEPTTRNFRNTRLLSAIDPPTPPAIYTGETNCRKPSNKQLT